MEKKFLKILKETYGVLPSELKDERFHKYGGRRQSKRKSEFIEAAQRIAAERGIPSYNPDRICDELGLGVPVGERFLEPVKVSGTDVLCEYEDL
ncbi:MAG: Methyl coenzyme M reductase, partial [Candidatus Alkanophagales archaeon MCA70_species_2]|nr:Methyl coenzyme M reductase [Candidatus Alkanophaga liquidiphilum]